MPTRNVVLTKHQHELIETLVGSGRYQNASEVLREGLRLVEQREAEDAAKLAVLRKAVRSGFRAYDRGEFKEFERMEDLETFLRKDHIRRGRMSFHDLAEMAGSTRHRGRARFCKHPAMDDGEIRRRTGSHLSGHARSGNR